MKVEWSVDVERRLRSMLARDAAAVRAGVLRFAQHYGARDLVPAEGSLIRRLRVAGYRVVMLIDDDGSLVRVVRIYRAE